MTKRVVMLMMVAFLGCEASKPVEAPKPAVQKDAEGMKSGGLNAVPNEPI